MSAHLVALDVLLSSEHPDAMLEALIVEMVERGVPLPSLKIGQWRNGVVIDVLRGDWLAERSFLPIGWEAHCHWDWHDRRGFRSKEGATAWVEEQLKERGWRILPGVGT